MPGQYQLSLDRLGETLAEATELGIPAIILFGIPEHKDARGSAAVRDDGIVQEAIRLAKRVAPDLLVITDLCFCEYTDHGHCGPLAEIGGRHRRRQRRHASAPRRAGRQPRPRRRRHDRPVRHDGRHGPGDPPGARRRGSYHSADHVLRRQVRQRLLRPVSRGGRERPQLRRPPQLPDGPRQHATRRSARWHSTWPKEPTS